jgi:hypothetical protein
MDQGFLPRNDGCFCGTGLTMTATYDQVVSYFHFWPSKDLAIVAMALFIFASLTVLVMTVKTRAW